MPSWPSLLYGSRATSVYTCTGKASRKANAHVRHQWCRSCKVQVDTGGAWGSSKRPRHLMSSQFKDHQPWRAAPYLKVGVGVLQEADGALGQAVGIEGLFCSRRLEVLRGLLIHRV